VGYLVSYLSTLVIFTGIDMVWLGLVAPRLYRPVLGDILLDKPRLSAAIVFYLLYAAGIVVFAVSGAVRGGGWTQALLYGGLFGLFAYATYDLTNQATLRNWSLTLTIADIIWGSFLTGVAAALSCLITGALVRNG
jgi:uncharacterized membrane protein